MCIQLICYFQAIKLNSCSFSGYVTAQDMRCIELLYDEYGLDFIDAVRENVSSALPVILNRLKQKEEEILEKLSDFSEVWTEAQATNHLRSLDHRSFYFKQQDPKALSSKGNFDFTRCIMDPFSFLLPF